MNSKKALVILSPGFAANEADSACLPAQQQLVKTVSELFPSIQLIVLAFQYPFSEQSYQWNGIPVIPFNGRNKSKLYRLFIWLRVWKQLNTLKKKYTLIGLFSFWYGECALTGKWFGKYNGIKHLTWLLGQDAKKGNKYIARIHLPAAELVALSDRLAAEFKKNYAIAPAHIIPAGIDTRLYAKMPAERDIDILGVGSLIPLKRYDLFIEMVSVLKKDFPRIKTVICGKGVEEPILRAMIEKAGLQGSVILTGEKPHHEILQLMQRSKILLHPSSYEGFGVVCLEALYAGAHVASFFCPQDAWIKHWHVAENEQLMIDKLSELLRSDTLDHSPVLPYTMKDTATAIMKLFAGESFT
jgi:glycosyltransferase involved in cell wall biosynthesis